MAVGLLCPIYKRGDLGVSANYRHVVISSVLHKLYALCLKSEFESLSGARQLQIFPRQAGFLKERSTLHNMFVLQHLAHHHKRLGTPLYVSLLDVKGPYDTTVHGHMVDTLLQQPLPQHLGRGVAGMYQTLQYQAHAGGISAAPFDVGIGVKHGCPSSPLLYNLYVQPLSDQLASLEVGPQFPAV